MKVIFVLSFLVIVNISFGQYEKIDSYVKNLKLKKNITISEAAKAITATSKTDIEKVRALYVWFANNIEYDINAIRSRKQVNSTPGYVLKSKMAVCSGYGKLFNAFCTELSIPSLIVSGYSKGFGYENRKKLDNTDHDWNVVKIQGKWHLIDVTWGSGHINDHGRYIQQLNNKYFLTRPDEFITRHLPGEPIMQLLPCPISPEEFLLDTTEVKKLAQRKEKCMNAQDSINSFYQLDSTSRLIASARRMYNYLPENAFTPAMMLNNAAYHYTSQLNSESIPVEDKLDMAKNGLKCYEMANDMIKNKNSSQYKQLKQMLKANIGNTKNFIDFYKNK